MFERIYHLTLIIGIMATPIIGQESDEAIEEEGGREMFTSVDVSFSEDKGNTNFRSLYYGADFTLIGDMGPLTDTEFLFSFSRSDDQLDGESFTDDQSLILKFDIWANQRISPFLFFQNSYDKTIGLNDRLNYGLGAKINLFKGLSLSYAFLAETEEYQDYYIPDYSDSSQVSGDDYWDTYYDIDDSTTNYYRYDSTFVSGTSEFFRHSIRPKFKIKLMDENIVFDYRFYFKPKVDDFSDYLLEHEVKISIATFYELLMIDFNYSNKYNKRFDAAEIINNDTGMPYKAVDENISLGFSFMF